MTIIFYTTQAASPPCRAVETIIKIIKLNVEYRYINLFTKEHLESWYLKLNPAHQVPVLDDDGFILTDSHAIIAYLMNAYAPKEILEQYYPTDLKQRAIVDSMWYFDNGTLFARGKAMLLPILRNRKDIPLEATKWTIEALDMLEQFLDGKAWLAGDRLTVADISAVTTVDLIQHLVPIQHYKNVSAWAENARETIPFIKKVGVTELKDLAALLKRIINYEEQGRLVRIHSSVKD